MIKALRGQSIIEYKDPGSYGITNEGLLVPSEALQRQMLRNQEKKMISIDAPPPDIIRWGVLVAGDPGVPIGTVVYFNRHDADYFKLDDKQYYRIRNDMALAYFEL